MSRLRAHPAWAPALIVVGFALFMLAFAGCGSDDDDDGGSGAEAATEVGEPEGELNLVAWAGYVEDGSTDPAVDWVTGLREGDRLPGQRQGRKHVGRDGDADAHRRVRRRFRIG